MNSFELYIPTIYVFGADVENEVGARCVEQGATKVLIHYGGQSAEKSGLLNRVRKSLAEAGLPYLELGGVEPNPRMDLAYKGINLIKARHIDFILSVGGGSVIDSAKCIAAGALYDGDAWDFYTGKAEPAKAVKLGCILTIPAAGSEGSKDSVMQLIDKDGIVWKRATSGYALYNSFALLNPELTWTLPKNQTAAGCADIFTHVTERYFTNTKGTYLIDNFCESILRTIRHYAPLVIADPKHKEAREQILWAGTMAHNNICGVGRIQDWASHSIEHELSGLYDVAHGAGLATVLPAWMRVVYKNDIARFVRFATEVFGVENDPFDQEGTALKGIFALRDFFSSLGLPISLSELGGKQEDIPFLVKNVSYSEDGTVGNFVKLDQAGVSKVYKFM